MLSTDDWPCATVRDADLSGRTTLRVGGRAPLLLEPATPDELRAAVAWVRARGEPVRLLGGGANLIIADDPVPGPVIATDRLRRAFRFVPHELRMDLGGEREDATDDPFVEVQPRQHFPETETEPRLVAWAGASMPGLVGTAKRLGWSGLEGLAGVPGSIGGGVAMNAGGSWGDLWDVVERVRVIEANGEFADLVRADCAPTYRNGNLGERVVAGVVLKLAPSHPKIVEAEVARYLLHKREVQPVTEWSAGCIFKNPDPERSGGKSAGRLVDEAGLKGRALGGAQVSPKHGNFIVNTGGATAADVLALIDLVVAEVAARTGVELEREVKVWRAD